MKTFCLAIICFGCLISSISAQRTFSPVSLVPGKSVAVLRVNWAEVRHNDKLKAIINGADFAKIENALGLSDSKVAEWVIFSDIQPASSSGLGIIISGSFTSQSIIQAVKAKGWKTGKIGTNAAAYINPADDSYLLPIRNGLLALGTKPGIEKLQSGLARPQNNLLSKSPFRETWAQLTSNRQPITFMIGIPNEFQRIADIGYKVAAKLMNLASFGIIGTVMETIGLTRCMGFGVSHREGVFPTNLVSLMADEGTAWLASGALNLLKKAPSAMGVQPKTEDERRMLESMQTMSASYNEAVLSVKFDMPESAVIR